MLLLENVAARVAGGNLDAVTERVVAIFGSNFKPKVQQWMRLFKGMHADLRRELHEFEHIPQKHLFDNASWLLSRFL